MFEISKPDQTLKKILPSICPRPGVMYIPSQFTLPFEHNDNEYVFQNLTKQCIKGKLPLSARAGEGFDDLIEAQFLVPEDKDECAYYNQISALMRAYSLKGGVRNYVIIPTLGCNARCVYCYEEGIKQIAMTPETVEQTIRFILSSHQGDQVKLSWFGGEPLLGGKAIDRICEGLREAGLSYKSNMISNGSLITPKIIHKMKKDWALTRIQISMDGAEQDYILRKHYFDSDHDYYHKVITTINAMSKAGIAVTIRCNVDEENWNRIQIHLKDLQKMIQHKEKVSLYFSPLYDVRSGNEDVAMWQKILFARRLIEDAGFRPAPFMDLNLRFRTNHCMADGESVLITPDGSLYLCEHWSEESRFGDIWHGETDEAARKEFCRVDMTRQKCRKCPFLPDCTSFSNCPIEDQHCRQVHELVALDALRRLIDHQKYENVNEDNLVC